MIFNTICSHWAITEVSLGGSPLFRIQLWGFWHHLANDYKLFLGRTFGNFIQPKYTKWTSALTQCYLVVHVI